MWAPAKATELCRGQGGSWRERRRARRRGGRASGVETGRFGWRCRGSAGWTGADKDVLTTGTLHRAQGAPHVCHMYTHYVTIRDFACTQIFQPRHSCFRHEPSDDAGIQAINIEATIESVPLRHLMGRALDAIPVDQSTSIKPEP